MAEVERFRQLFSMPDLPDLPRFTGGLVGYFGYDTVRYVEPRLAHSQPKDELGTPDILLMASDEVAIFDNLSGTLMLVVHVDAEEPKGFEKANARLDELQKKLSEPAPVLPDAELKGEGIPEDAFSSSFGARHFFNQLIKLKTTLWQATPCRLSPPSGCLRHFTASPLNLISSACGVSTLPLICIS